MIRLTPEQVAAHQKLSDMFIYGIGISKIGVRKWWNTMRWFKGPIYQKRINPMDYSK